MIGLTPTTRSRRRTSTSRTPGTARIGPIEITGLRRADEDRSRPPRARRARPGAGRAASAPSKSHRDDRRLGALAHEPLLHRELLVAAVVAATVIRVATRSSVIGSSRGATPHAAAISAVTSVSVAPAAQALGAEEVGGEVAVAEAEPGVLRRSGRARRWWRRSRRRGPSPVSGLLGAGERVRDRCRGRGRRSRPWNPSSSPVLTTTVTSARVDDLRRAHGGSGPPPHHPPAPRSCGERTGPASGSGTPGGRAPGTPGGRAPGLPAGGFHAPGREGRDGTLSALMSALEPPDAPVAVPADDEPPSPSGRREPSTASPTARPEDEQLAQYPPVVAVVVTRNPGPWLEDTLRRARRARTTPISPCSWSTAGRRTTRRRGSPRCCPARSCAASTTAPGSPARPTRPSTRSRAPPSSSCATTTSCSTPTALRVLVEEAYRSNAGIVGPKLVERRQPRDPARGRPRHRPLRRALHRDRARRARPGAARRRARRLLRHHRDHARAHRPLRRARGLRSRDVPGRRGPRSLLAGAARGCPRARRARRAGRAPRSGRRALRGDRPDEFALARSRVRVLFTSYSLPRLLWLVPFGFVVGFVEAFGDLLTGRPRRARAAIGSWFSNVRALPAAARLAATGPAAPARARLRAARAAGVEHRAARRLPRATTSTPTPACATLGDASRSAVDSVSDGVRTPAAIAFLGFLVLVVIGSRDLLTHGVPAIGTFGHWASVGDVFDSFGSAWRYTGLGSASPAPAALALIGAMGTVLLGAVGLAQTLTVVLALPLGAFGAYRLARHVIGLRGPALAAGLAYGINPVARNAIAQGRLGPLVLFARPALPDAAHRPARRARRRPAGSACCGSRCSPRCSARGTRSGSGSSWSRPPRSCWRSRSRDRRGWRCAGSGSRSSPRSAASCSCSRGRSRTRDTGVDKAALGFAFRPDLDLSQILRFDTGPVGRGLGDVGPGRRRRGAVVRRHRRPPGLDRARLDARARRLGRGVGARALLPRHVGARARSRAHPRRARARAVPRDRGVGVRRRHPLVPVRVAPARGHRRRVRHPAPRAAVHRRRRRRPLARARRPTGPARSRSREALTRQGRVPDALGRRSRACSRSIRWCCATAPATRSPATGPATSPSSGARPSTPPTTSSTGRSVSPPPGSPTASAGCSRRWACATSWCRARREATAGRRPRCPVRVRAAMAQQLDLAQLRSSRRASCSTRTWRTRPSPQPWATTPVRVPIELAASERRRARAPISRTRPRSARGPCPGAPCCGARRTTRSGTRRAAAPRCATTRRSDGRTGSRSTAAATVSITYERAVATLGDARRRARALAPRRVAVAAHARAARSRAARDDASAS